MTSDWFSRRLGITPSQPAPVQQPTPQQPSNPGLPEVEPPKTTYDKNEGMCPGCGSGNYFSQQRTLHGQQGSWRCYDCGYPIVQAGSGAGTSTKAEGPVKPARQPASSVGWQPQATFVVTEGGSGQVVPITEGQ